MRLVMADLGELDAQAARRFGGKACGLARLARLRRERAARVRPGRGSAAPRALAPRGAGRLPAPRGAAPRRRDARPCARRGAARTARSAASRAFSRPCSRSRMRTRRSTRSRAASPRPAPNGCAPMPATEPAPSSASWYSASWRPARRVCSSPPTRRAAIAAPCSRRSPAAARRWSRAAPLRSAGRYTNRVAAASRRCARRPERAGPPSARASPSVSPGRARLLAESLGGPLDLEWAIDAEARIWWLQARPITALREAPPLPDAVRSCPEAREGPVTVWTRLNVRETLPEPLVPFSWSFWRDLVAPLFARVTLDFPPSPACAASSASSISSRAGSTST